MVLFVGKARKAKDTRTSAFPTYKGPTSVALCEGRDQGLMEAESMPPDIRPKLDGQSLPLAFISAARFICSSVISGGPGLKVILLIVPVKVNGN